MSDAITFERTTYRRGDKEVETTVEVFIVEREDIVAVERDEDEPDEFLVVYTGDGEKFFYYITPEDSDEYAENADVQEWLLDYSVSHDYASHSY